MLLKNELNTLGTNIDKFELSYEINPFNNTNNNRYLILKIYLKEPKEFYTYWIHSDIVDANDKFNNAFKEVIGKLHKVQISIDPDHDRFHVEIEDTLPIYEVALGELKNIQSY